MIYRIWNGEYGLEYINKVWEIINTYNETAVVPEEFRARNLTATKVIHAMGVRGGLFLDVMDEGYCRIMFAAWEQRWQRKGLLRGCLQHAHNQGLEVGMVEVGFGEANEVWKKMGFTENAWAGGPCLAWPSIVDRYATKTEGLEVEDFLKGLEWLK